MNNQFYVRLARIVLAVLIVIVGTALVIEVYGNSRKTPPTVTNNPIQTQTTPFAFAAAGDFGFTASADLVLRKIGESKTDFTLALGDLGYGGNGTEPAWCDFVHQRVGDAYPFQIVAGNHDDGSRDGNILEYKKCLPDKLSATGDYGTAYYFDHAGLARFIMIAPDIDTHGATYAKDSPYYNWLASAIDTARADNVTWVILGMHKNCINIESKSCEIGEDLLNLAVEKKVDVVLQGHQHGYSRSKQLGLSSSCPAVRANSVTPSCVVGEGNTLIKDAGSIIVTAGTGGVDLRDINLADSEIGYFETWNGRNVGNSHGFSKFSVSSTELKGEFVPVNGGFVDTFTVAAH